MNDWPLVAIDELASSDPYAVVGGPFGSALGRKHYVEDGVPVIRGAQLGGPGQFSHDNLVFVTEAKADQHEGNLAYPGDLVVTQRGTVGQVGRVPEDTPFDRYLLSQSQMKLAVDKQRACPRFVYYALKAPTSQQSMLGSTISAGVPHINLKTFRGLEIGLPTLTVQRGVSSILGALDDLIENNRRRVEVLEEMARTIYREWFVHFRFPGHEDATFVDSDLGPIPDGWSVRELSEVAGVNNESRTPTDDEVIRYLDISSLGERDFEIPGPSPGVDAPGRARRIVRAGDTVWSMVRPNRRAHALLVEPADDWIASTGTAVLTPELLSPALLFETVSSGTFSAYLVSRQRGSAYPAVKVADFKAAPLTIPDRALGKRFTESVEPIHNLAWKLRQQARVLARIRDLLLPKLVMGQIDVSDLDLNAVVERAGA